MNDQLIKDYFRYKKTLGEGISNKTVHYQSNILKTFNEFVNKPFKEVTKEDVTKYLEPNKNINTLDTKKTVLRQFYKWLFNVQRGQMLPDCISWIEFSSRATKQRHRRANKDKRRVITEDEYLKLVKACKHPQHKAILETLWTFGARVGELVSVNVGHIQEKENFITITFPDSKTKDRTVPFKGYPQHLMHWVNYRKGEGAKENDPLFISLNPIQKYAGNRLSINGVQKLMNRLIIYAELERKRLSPHDFRHTAITRELGKGMPKTHAETFFGLVKGSAVFKVYDHNDYEELRKYIVGEGQPKEERPESYEKIKRKKDQLEKELRKEIANLKTDLEKKAEIDNFIMDSLGLIAKEMVQNQGIEAIKEIFRKYNVPLIED